MAKGKPGADSSVMVTNQVGGDGLIDLAKAHYGETPVFWGRYFATTSTGGTVEYRHLEENKPLRDNNIRVLPIARQTRDVNGTEAGGSTDARRNADDLIATFGADYLASLSGEFYMFLDVEGSPNLSQEYYTGWAQTLVAHSGSVTGGRVIILPCVYATHSDDATWSSVAAAVAAGAQCKGAWIARWPASGCQPLPEWSDDLVTPSVGIPCPVLIWQYADDCYGGGGFDCSETNPGIDLQNDLLSHLVLPPEMTGVST
ncbi:MAG: hypothetical protein ABSH44_04135 [Bryobacteraceae bacterium]|jgi:hypothetical protein